MRLENITASPHSNGNRIDLTWVNPDTDTYPSVRVVRREGTYPKSIKDGVVVHQFNLDLSLESEFAEAQSSPALREQFARYEAPLTPNATIEVISAGVEWRIHDSDQEYRIQKKEARLQVQNERLPFATDQDLKGETVYYYALIPYKGNRPSESDFDPHNRISTMSTSPYNFAAVMYDLLPRIYHRYDSLPTNHEENNQIEQLRRFLELPGGQLDQLYSLARSVLELHHLKDVDGRLLPLLAQWIGWSLDHRQEFARQRNEVRDAPYVQDTIGIIPTLEATVKRLFGWESRTKEFLHNVFLSNSPPRLNLYLCEADGGAGWSEPSLLSLDFAYEGRPVVVETQEGPSLQAPTGWHRLWLFYHTRRKEQWDIWYKTLDTFHLDFPPTQLTGPGLVPSKLHQAFKTQELRLSSSSQIFPVPGALKPKWQVVDDETQLTATIEAAGEEGSQVRLWRPSQPLKDSPSIDRHPTVAAQVTRLLMRRERLWLFWDVYDEGSKSWRIDGRIHDPLAGWVSFKQKDWPFDLTKGAERKRPWAVTYDQNGVWLFWLERDENHWQLKYNRHNGTEWQSVEDVIIPEIEKYLPFEDLFVLFEFNDNGPLRRLWIFWAHKVVDTGAVQWEIVYIIKQIENDHLLEGGQVLLFPAVSSADDREPSAWLNEADKIELFWSSNRIQDPTKPSSRSWSLWHSVLSGIEAETGEHTWSPAMPITGNPYMQRNPLPVKSVAGSMLFFRSNESLRYSSSVYGATETLDARYAGSITVDTRALAQKEQWNKFDDFQTYTYEINSTEDPLHEPVYNRDTVGIYLDDLSFTENEQREYKSTLQQFMSLGVKPLFLVEPKDEQQPTSPIKSDNNS